MADDAASASLFGVAGRVACVTGASSGLGRRAATVLAEAGARVVGVARRADALDAWQAEAGGQTAAVTGDVADRDGLAALADRIAAPYGAPDIVIHAAGLNTREPADDVTPEGWDKTLAVNLTAPFFLSQCFVPAMREKGWGRIVNFASLQSFRAFPGGIAYGASKGGVAQMTRAMAEAWSGAGITANALGPGFFRTELTARVFENEALAGKLADQTCMGRNGAPEDIDGPLLFLCSRASDYVTGQILMVDGGFTAK
ncbi:SDR family NAD(P)-dependent oxidoreductase [Ovoidimarina sediminis]|uniref:SDR family NAD(P)-dependent oxidoreductase n=1 Tax=Ovoidimarina sediminis TaxID=3079856 RepID=UPI0029126667|nr:SDR family oxidoreductase [Rhodophyticola sp. MJ-SS7]MDU8946040.1 SDR family oxidoreductase [Rhodophyticola sp. MJ-SS7]